MGTGDVEGTGAAVVVGAGGVVGVGVVVAGEAAEAEAVVLATVEANRAGPGDATCVLAAKAAVPPTAESAAAAAHDSALLAILASRNPMSGTVRGPRCLAGDKSRRQRGCRHGNFAWDGAETC